LINTVHWTTFIG